MQEPLIDESSSKLQVVLLLTLSVSMVSSASILILLSTSPALVVVFWRTLYGAIFMAMIGLLRRDFSALRRPEVKKNWYWLIIIGIILSFHFSTWFQSLRMTTVAASVVLVDSSPIFTAILSTLVLGESLRRRSWIGVLVAVLGAVILAWGDFGGTNIIGGRRFAKGMPITVYTSIVYLFAAITTLVLCIPFGYNVLVFEPTEVAIFIALAIFPTVLGHSVNNYLLTKVPAYVVSSAVLGEPIGATILAALIFVQYPAPITLVGFFVILSGVAVVLSDLVAKEKSHNLSFDHTDGS